MIMVMIMIMMIIMIVLLIMLLIILSMSTLNTVNVVHIITNTCIWLPVVLNLKLMTTFNGLHFDCQDKELPNQGSVVGARVLLKLGDSVTTDHISPAGSIPRNSPAARYLSGRGCILLYNVTLLHNLSSI